MLMGFLIANGNLIKQTISKKYNYIKLSSNYYKEMEEKIIKPICREYNCNYNLNTKKYDMTINCTELAEKLNELGFSGVSKTKTIPEWLFFETEENISYFLKGYMSGDGTIIFRNNKPIIKCDSVNKELLKGIRILFNRVGIASSYSEDKTELLDMVINVK
jgi:intein/homing endonuclease